MDVGTAYPRHLYLDENTHRFDFRNRDLADLERLAILLEHRRLACLRNLHHTLSFFNSLATAVSKTAPAGLVAEVVLLERLCPLAYISTATLNPSWTASFIARGFR